MDSNPNPDLTELQDFVDNLPPKALKRYLSTNPHLKSHLPQSLKLAKNPAKLVLEAIGKYYVNNSKIYTNAQQIAARVASVMLLEAFVMISSDEGVEVGECERKLAEESAVVWRNRMVKEGGVGNVEEIDARGLLLLVSGFGVRGVGIGELRDLIRRADVKGIAGALRRSQRHRIMLVDPPLNLHTHHNHHMGVPHNPLSNADISSYSQLHLRS
ncbi:putative frigida-like protein [Tanacetum coccineum]